MMKMFQRQGLKVFRVRLILNLSLSQLEHGMTGKLRLLPASAARDSLAQSLGRVLHSHEAEDDGDILAAQEPQGALHCAFPHPPQDHERPVEQGPPAEVLGASRANSS